MGVFSTVFVGITPFGTLAGGVVAQRLGVSAVLLGGAGAVLAGSVAFHLALPRLRRGAREMHPELLAPPPPPP
jgi:hypothetical protein